MFLFFFIRKNQSFSEHHFFSSETRLFQTVAAVAAAAAVIPFHGHKESRPSTSITWRKTRNISTSSWQKKSKSEKLIRIAPNPNSPTPPLYDSNDNCVFCVIHQRFGNLHHIITGKYDLNLIYHTSKIWIKEIQNTNLN